MLKKSIRQTFTLTNFPAIQYSVSYELSAMYTIIELLAFSIQNSIKVLMNCGKFHLIFLHAKVNASNI